MAVNDETRKLMKLLHLEPDEMYHVFCLALCMAHIDGRLSDREGEVLTRIGFGFGLDPDDIQALGQNALQAIAETSPEDVLAFSIARLKTSLPPERLQSVRTVLRYIAAADKSVDPNEAELLKAIDDLWGSQ